MNDCSHFTAYNKYVLLMNSLQYAKYDFKLFTVQGRNFMFFYESFMKPI